MVLRQLCTIGVGEKTNYNLGITDDFGLRKFWDMKIHCLNYRRIRKYAIYVRLMEVFKFERCQRLHVLAAEVICFIRLALVWFAACLYQFSFIVLSIFNCFLLEMTGWGFDAFASLQSHQR